MASLVTTVTDTLVYRGKLGQWSWVAHRIAGLGTLLFFIIHVLDTSTAAFSPTTYLFFIKLYRNPIFGVGEIILIACVLFHGVNGIRITALDLKPEWWRYQRQWAIGSIIVFIILFIPVLILMGSNILTHLNG